MVKRIIILIALAIISCEKPTDPNLEPWDSMDELLNTAWANYDGGKHELAFSQFKDITLWRADLAEVQLGLGWSALYKGDERFASSAFSLARSLALSDEDLIPAYIGSAIISIYNNNDDNALQWLIKAEELIDEDYKYNHYPYFDHNSIIKSEAGCYLRANDIYQLQFTIERMNPGFIENHSDVSFTEEAGYYFRKYLWVEFDSRMIIKFDSLKWFDTVMVIDTLDSLTYDTTYVIDTSITYTPEMNFQIGNSEVGFQTNPMPPENVKIHFWFHEVANLRTYIESMISELGTW